MTKFIELESYNDANHVWLSVKEIVMIEQMVDKNFKDDGCEITLKSNSKVLKVTENYPDISYFIKQAEQENPYRTK